MFSLTSSPRRVLLLLVLCALPLAAGVATAQAQSPEASLEPPAQQGGQDEPRPTRELGPITELRIEGLRYQSQERVADALGQSVGEPFDPAAFARGVQSLWDVYRILVVSRSDPPEGLVLIEVVETPVDLEPRFVGNTRYDTAKLREWARIADRGEIYLHEAPAIRERLLEAYRRKGYHHVEIEVVDTAGDPERGTAPDVIFEIREGPRVRVKGVFVRGNESIPDTGWGPWRGGLMSQARLKTKGRGLLRWWGGIFDELELRADLVAMRNIYRDRGWLDAKVEIEHLEFSLDRSAVRVHVIVDEGPLWRVESVDVEAVELTDDGETREVELLFPEQELVAELELSPGIAFEAARLDHDRRALRDYYGERGYLDAQLFSDPSADGWRWLTPSIVQNFERKEVRVVYRIRQGRERFLREILFQGNTHTRDKVLRRELSIEEGDRVDLRQVERSLRRINGTGYFSDQQSLEHRDPYFVFIESEDDPAVVDLEYRVQEGRVLDAGISGGISSDRGLVAQLQVSKRNFDASNLPDSFGSFFGDIYDKTAFHGNGELLQLNISPGSEVSELRLRYRHPDIFGTHYERWSLDSEFFIRDRLFRSHDEERARIRPALERQIGFNHLISFGPTWDQVKLSDIEEDAPSTLLESDESATFQGLRAEWRYMDLDNRISPREGYFVRFANIVYGGPFGGDNDLWQSELVWNAFVPFNAQRQDVFPGLFLELAGEVAKSFGDPEQVHYSERKFLGGPSSLRGFDYRGVGPFEGDFPVGGETLVRATVEYRYPLYSVPVPGTSQRREMFRGFLFFDAGLTDPEAFALDLDELRSSVGFGFGLTYPLPLTFNFGFPIQSEDEDDLEVFSFRISFFR